MTSTDVDLSLRGCDPTPEHLGDGFSPPPIADTGDVGDDFAESQLPEKCAF